MAKGRERTLFRNPPLLLKSCSSGMYRLSPVQAHAGTWREFDNQDIRLAANPTIEGDTLVLIFSLYEAQGVEERIPLR